MAGQTLSAQLRGFNPQGFAAPLIVIMMLAMVVIPLPPMALDMLFTFNITFALVVLLVSVYALRPLDFTVFPTILLIATLLRLALNIASTRIVLLEEGPELGAAMRALVETQVRGDVRTPAGAKRWLRANDQTFNV